MNNMKRTICSIIFLINFNINAQIVNVPQVIQEQSEWCWAGVTKSILDYYGFKHSQCEIAEYARQVITWNNFGSTDCCVNPSVGCNHWNNIWGTAGSVQDILNHFGNIKSISYGTLSLSQINTEISNGRPFVIRWLWKTGGGHFVVGHGVNGNDVYYMNPWVGEGLHISNYNWLVNDGTHTWTHTNMITSNLNTIDHNLENEDIVIYPNPCKSTINISGKYNIKSIKILNTNGQLLKLIPNSNNSKDIQIEDLQKGIYFLELNINDMIFYKKFIKE